MNQREDGPGIRTESLVTGYGWKVTVRQPIWSSAHLNLELVVTNRSVINDSTRADSIVSTANMPGTTT